ncbi:MAG TPA: serine hydrolase domain-containing protein, partial [Thermoanaerobaculia bacterium]|nr:serine hydrolase domain-containing protein [Thermoanaerobaculia bacterium]
MRILLAILLLASPARAADPLVPRIDARVREYVDAGLFSGVVLVARGDSIVYEKAFGLADRTFDIPNTMTTKFHIASVSKPITAAAVLLLADRGKLDLQWPVSRVLPDFPNGGRITIEQVLTHYSGLDDTSSKPDFEQWSRFPQTPASLVERLAKLPLRSEINKEFRYSNANYHLLALIIEKVSGQTYGDFLRDAIFRPLAMNSSGHHGDEREIIPRLATGYLPKAAAEYEKPSGFDWTAKTGNGSLYTTAGDLLRFHRALQHGTLLKPETARASLGFDRKDRTVGMFWFPGT